MSTNKTNYLNTRKKTRWSAMVTWIAVLLSIFCMLPALRTEAAVKNPAITVKAVSKISTTNAQINAAVKNPGKKRLKRCGFILYDANGKQLKNKYDSINYTMTSFNAWFDMNEYYGKLKQNTTYKYKFYVMDSSSKYYYSAQKSFTTKKAAANPTITVNAVSNVSSANAQINAVVNNSGQKSLKQCGFILYDASGKKLATKYDSINYTLKSFNAWFDMNEYYGSLKANTKYQYKFFVKDSASNYYYSGMNSFTTAKKAAGGAKKLTYDKNAIAKIGAQPAGSVYCSVYAMSYARAVAGKTPYDNPMSYWGAEGAYWGRGGLRSIGYGTEQAALKKAYDEINAGRPIILKVYGPKVSTQHYVTAIGYKNVTNVNALSVANFICIDPGYGTEKDMSIYTGLKVHKGSYQTVMF